MKTFISSLTASDHLDHFAGGEGKNHLFNFFEGSNKEMWVRNRRKRFYGEIWGNAVRGGGTCKNPARLSMKDGPMETVEYMCVNIWWMFIAPAKILEYEGSISLSSFYGQLLDY